MPTALARMYSPSLKVVNSTGIIRQETNFFDSYFIFSSWGHNGYCQLGNGSTNQGLTPAIIQNSLLGRKVVQVNFPFSSPGFISRAGCLWQPPFPLPHCRRRHFLLGPEQLWPDWLRHNNQPVDATEGVGELWRAKGDRHHLRPDKLHGCSREWRGIAKCNAC